MLLQVPPKLFYDVPKFSVTMIIEIQLAYRRTVLYETDFQPDVRLPKETSTVPTTIFQIQYLVEMNV